MSATRIPQYGDGARLHPSTASPFQALPSHVGYLTQNCTSQDK